MENRHRIQFDFSEDAYSRIQKMKTKAGATSYAHVVRDALRVYEWYLEQKQAGCRFLLVKDDKNIKEVELIL